MSRRARGRYLDGTALTARVSACGYRGCIKSIQRGTITITGATSNTATITAVDPNNAELHLLGMTTSAALAGNQGFARLTFTNATTITATVNTSPGGNNVIVSFEVREYYPGVIKSVQRGTIALAGVTPVTATVTTVNTAKAQLATHGFSTSDAGLATTVQTSLVLTNATTITASSVGTAANQTVGYELREFY